MANDAETDVPGTDADDAAAAPGGSPVVRRRWVRGRSWWVAGPLLIYVTLVLAGITQSSIGIDGLREDAANPSGIMIGPGLPIRSDEYLTSTPILLGVAATGQADDDNPLTAPQGFFTLVPDGPVSAVVLFDGAVLRLGPMLPDQMLLAAHWWLPYLLLALGAPVYFRALTGSRWIGLFAAFLVAFSPASAWWSGTPVGILGFALAGSAALLRCRDLIAERRIPLALAWGAGSAVLLARIPLLYQPWAVVVAVAVLAVAVLPMVVDRTGRRAGLLAVGGVGAAALLLAGGTVLENLDGLRASLGTTYPGARLSSGSTNPLQEVFAATSLANLHGRELIGTNASEISSSFAVGAVWAILLLLVGVRFRDGRHRVAVLTALGFVAFWFAWCLVDFGGWAAGIPIVNRVPSYRAADVVGFLAILLLCLVLPALTGQVTVRRALLIAGSVAAFAAVAGSKLRDDNAPSLSTTDVWMSSVLLAAVVLVVTLRPRRWQGYAAGVVLAAALIWNVNPVLVGLADLRGSDVAQQMLLDGADAREQGAVWASDDVYVDALLTSTGVPSLSGRQLAGPDDDAWRLLDPTGGSEAVWNRGGAYIEFVWTDDDEVVMVNPSNDIIQVRISPCVLHERLPELGTVVASAPLTSDCVSESGSFTWNGATRWMYRVVG